MPDYKKQFNQEQRVASLRKGDILLKRNLDGFKSDPIGNVISAMQMITMSSGQNLPGAYVSGHAALYDGNGAVAEANGNGVVLTPLTDVNHVRYIVYRCSNQQAAERAADIAVLLTGRRRMGRGFFGGEKFKDGTYAGGWAAASLLNPRQKGPLGMGDRLLQDVQEIANNPQSNRATPNFFCSMFVYTVYEVALPQHLRFNFDPYSIDPKFYHKLLESNGNFQKQGKYIHAMSESTMENECYNSVTQALRNYKNLKEKQQTGVFAKLRKTSAESVNAVQELNKLVANCAGKAPGHENYGFLIIASLYYTRSFSEILKFFPDMSMDVNSLQANLREEYGEPLGTGSTLLAEFDKTSFFKRLRSVRKS